jgi:surface antigen
MFGRGLSYTGGGGQRQSRAGIPAIAAVALSFTLGGCAGMGLPFGEATEARMAQAESARAIPANATVIERVDPSDWETIRRSVASVPETLTQETTWFNPDTGSTGTVGVSVASEVSGTFCRPFATTINDTRGIRRYRGDACVRTDGRWQLHGIRADDTLLS